MAPAPSIQDLITEVLHDAPADTPLVRLRTAASMTDALTETTDAVLGHFVDQARRAGHSWTEIGNALGVTKQAAQQRHSPRLGGLPVTYERFTPRARHLMAQCEPLARELGHQQIGTEHLLLAQYSMPEGLGAQILIESGLSRDAVVSAIVEHAPRSEPASDDRLPFTADATEALTSTLTIALELGHNYIGTEHLLLGVARAPGLGQTILSGVGLDDASLRAKVTVKLADFVAATRAASGAQEAASKKPTAKKAAPKKAGPAKVAKRSS